MNNSSKCEHKYLNFLTKNYYLGPLSIHKIMNYFKTAKKAYKGNIEEYRKIGLTDKMIDQLMYDKENMDPDHEMKILKKEKYKDYMY